MFFASGNDQFDQATYTLLEAAQSGDLQKVLGCLPYVKAAIADLPVGPTCKRALMMHYDAMVAELKEHFQ